MEPQMASKRLQNPIKNELETKSTKHVENVLNLKPLDLQETHFRMERLSKTTKARGADKSKKNTKKWCRNEAKIHEQSASELNKKRCLNTELKKPKKSQKMTSKWPQKMILFWGKCLLGRLWWSKPFL